MTTTIHPKHQTARNNLAARIVDHIETTFPDVAGLFLARIHNNNRRYWNQAWRAVVPDRQPSDETKTLVVNELAAAGTTSHHQRQARNDGALFQGF